MSNSRRFVARLYAAHGVISPCGIASHGEAGETAGIEQIPSPADSIDSWRTMENTIHVRTSQIDAVTV